MGSYSSLLVIDVSSYGSALALINQFCDDDEVKVFEVSPIGHAGLLILLIKDETAANLLRSEIFSFYKSNVLSISLINKFDPRILKAYLSQNRDEISQNILVQEFSFVSDAFTAAQNLFAKNLMVIDFRVVRTYPLSAIVITTSSDVKPLLEIKGKARSATIIEKVNPALKSYFQIVKN